ncbi:hypothetical protein D9M72_303360 [compost metagenome]
MDFLEPANGRPIEADAGREQIVVDFRQRDREVLPHAGQVGEPEVNDLDCVRPDQIDDFAGILRRRNVIAAGFYRDHAHIRLHRPPATSFNISLSDSEWKAPNQPCSLAEPDSSRLPQTFAWFAYCSRAGDSTSSVDVPWARTRPSFASTRASAVMICRPWLTTRPSTRTLPVSGLIGREKFPLVSTVV